MAKGQTLQSNVGVDYVLVYRFSTAGMLCQCPAMLFRSELPTDKMLPQTRKRASMNLPP